MIRITTLSFRYPRCWIRWNNKKKKTHTQRFIYLKMKVEYTRLLIVLICLIVRITNADVSIKSKWEFFFYLCIEWFDIKGQQCRDYAGDRSNCQRFIRCFYNLRVLFTCASGTAYVPDLQTCVATELVNDCDDSKNRIGKFKYSFLTSIIIICFWILNRYND